MLKNLTITNYALIEHLDLDFESGLTIVTGETGAGKSIMLGALSLLTGSRADSKVIADGGKKSVVEARFVNGDAETKVRREITSSGRSKVYIDDAPVTLQKLAGIMPGFIDIHSQHANAKINNPAERLRIIDAFASNDVLRGDYKSLFDEYVDLRRQLKAAKEASAKMVENEKLIRYQLSHLDALAPKRGELVEVERRYEVLSDADEIKEKLSALAAMLGDGETGVKTTLGDAAALSDKIDFNSVAPGHKTTESTIAQRIRELLVEVGDIAATVEDVNMSVDTDPATLQQLSKRMDDYYAAIKFFNVAEADELAALHEDLKRQAGVMDHGDRDIAKMEKEARRLGHELKQKADALTESRIKAAAEFSALLCDTARPLGLPNIRFEARVEAKKLAATGQDEVEFLCSFNKNGELRPVGDIASGGEISRLMLSLKSILAGRMNLPTIIFDEVDTGVSGEIADKMGRMMHAMGQDMQVVTITHLPQVAAFGDEHFKVYKTDADTRTVTHVRKLTREERVRELAAMISGSEVSEAALTAARELLK